MCVCVRERERERKYRVPFHASHPPLITCTYIEQLFLHTQISINCVRTYSSCYQDSQRDGRRSSMAKMWNMFSGKLSGSSESILNTQSAVINFYVMTYVYISVLVFHTESLIL